MAQNLKFAVRIAVAALAACAGCDRLPPSKPLKLLTPKEAAGRRVFLDRCSRCHYPDSVRALHGPGLKGLFRRPYLPSGGAATNERVIEIIQHGRNMMPAMGDTLNDAQMNNLLAYLHTL